MLTALVLVSLFGGAVGAAGESEAIGPELPGRSYWSSRSTRPPLEIAEREVHRRPERLGLDPGDLDTSELRDHTRSARTGVTHLFYRQRLGGLEVWNGSIGVHIDSEGRILRVGSRAVSRRRLPQGAGRQARLSEQQALVRVADALGIDWSGPALRLEGPIGIDQSGLFEAPGLSLAAIPMKLMWHAPADGLAPLRRVWNLALKEPSGLHWWDLNLDAETGEIRSRVDWTRRESYRVYPIGPNGVRDPDDGPRSLLVDPFDPTASPLGWHDVDGLPGAETTFPLGNNTDVSSDANDMRPSGGAGLLFDFPAPLSSSDSTSYLDAAVVNAF